MTQVSRAKMLRLIQLHLLPGTGMGDIAARLERADARGFAGRVATRAETEYEPVQSLHSLESEFSEFFEGREAESDREEAVLQSIVARRRQPVRRYRITQTVRIHADRHGGMGALTLWIPIPRSIPGVQEVRACFEPGTLEAYHWQSAGLLYGVPVLLDPFSPSPTTLKLTFEVEQSLSALLELRDVHLVPLDQSVPGGVVNWLTERGIRAEGSSDQCVDRVVRAMEESFQGTPYGPFSLDIFLRCGFGNVETLSSFLVAALQHLGLGARLSAGQVLPLADSGCELLFPDCFGYTHRFVHWADATAGHSGTVDLSYFRRWDTSNPDNTPDERLRTRLHRLGREYRGLLRTHVYPVDLIVAGVAPPSMFASLQSPRERFSVTAGVDTQIVAQTI